MEDLEADTAPLRTQCQRNQLLDLPRTLVDLERQIQEMANQLGSHQFREMTGTTGEIEIAYKFVPMTN